MNKKACRSFWLVLVVAFVHGTIYVFLMPPWQHYDEPSHFEYVWLLSSGKFSQDDSPDLSFRQKLVKSMIANDFYRDGLVPSLESIEDGRPIFGLEYSQLDEPPLFYLLSSPIVWLFRTRNPAVMLIAARMVSVGLFVLMIIAVWGIIRELTHPTHFLRIWGSLSIALLPGFVDLMTAVNNDVGAITAFTFFLWASIYFLNRPHSYWALIWVIFSTLICLGMKSTAFLAMPLGVLVLLSGWIKGKAGLWIWSSLIVLGLLGILAILTWEEPAYWHRGTSQLLPTRLRTEKAPIGDFALQIDFSAPFTPSFINPIQQPLQSPNKSVELTLGVWMWLSEDEELPVEFITPVLSTEKKNYFESVLVSANQQFYSFGISLPSDADRVWLSVSPTNMRIDNIVYYDGFVLVEGQFSSDNYPIFDSSDGASGVWNGKSFNNLIRNPSLESIWPAIRPEVDNRLAVLLPNNVHLSTLLFGMLDWTMTGPYFHFTANNLVETFWGRFGWGQVPLILPFVYKGLIFLTFTGTAGFIILFVRKKLYKNKKIIFLGLATTFVWTAAMLRGEFLIFTTHPFTPGARYAYPAIAPTLLGLILGWREWTRPLLKLLPDGIVDGQKIPHIILALFFLSLDIMSICSILIFFGKI